MLEKQLRKSQQVALPTYPAPKSSASTIAVLNPRLEASRATALLGDRGRTRGNEEIVSFISSMQWVYCKLMNNKNACPSYGHPGWMALNKLLNVHT